MISLAMPLGSKHGWGICGKYLVKELSALTAVRLFTEPFDAATIGDEFEQVFLEQFLPTSEQLRQIGSDRMPCPVLQAITNTEMQPYRPGLRGQPTVGYTFFETNLAVRDFIQAAQTTYDFIVTGSHWCEDVLRGYGLKGVTTILQGIDPVLFYPRNGKKEYFGDRFVVFSGGKLEFRKGQDLVIRAYKALQDKYRDVMLVNAWFNHWGFSLDTMRMSPYITFQTKAPDYPTLIRGLLAENGIDLRRVVVLGPHANTAMPGIYWNTDVGIFPNRCEGGTNLVLMEYMACGRPVIASYSSGHKDVLTDTNSLVVKTMKPVHIQEGQTQLAIWDDASLDEIIAHLEWAYLHRDSLSVIGQQAGRDMAQLTWRRCAERFYEVFTKPSASWA